MSNNLSVSMILNSNILTVDTGVGNQPTVELGHFLLVLLSIYFQSSSPCYIVKLGRNTLTALVLNSGCLDFLNKVTRKNRFKIFLTPVYLKNGKY